MVRKPFGGAETLSPWDIQTSRCSPGCMSRNGPIGSMTSTRAGPYSRCALRSIWPPSRRRSVVGSPAPQQAERTAFERALSDAGDPDRLVVERAAAADVGGPGPSKQVRVAVLAEMATLRQQGDVAALLRVVADLNGE